MPRAHVASAGLAALIGLALPSAGALAGDPTSVLYQWTDERGNIRYTPDPDRVPSGQRATMQRLEPGMPPASAPGRPVAAPTEPAPPQVQPPPAASAIPAPLAVPSASIVPVDSPSAEPAPGTSTNAVAAPGNVPGAAAGAVDAPSDRAAAVAVPSPTSPSEAHPAPQPAAADSTREQQLSAAIAADQERLKALLAAPRVPGDTALVDSPQLREIARRLPELQAELRALRERQTPPAGP